MVNWCFKIRMIWEILKCLSCHKISLIKSMSSIVSFQKKEITDFFRMQNLSSFTHRKDYSLVLVQKFTCLICNSIIMIRLISYSPTIWWSISRDDSQIILMRLTRLRTSCLLIQTWSMATWCLRTYFRKKKSMLTFSNSLINLKC